MLASTLFLRAVGQATVLSHKCDILSLLNGLFEGCLLIFQGFKGLRGKKLGVVSPHLPVGKEFLRFCLV